MIDTGASGTVLNGIYGISLQRHMRPSTLSNSHGIGGSRQYFYEEATVVFLDDKKRLFARTIRLGIQHIQPSDFGDPDSLYCPCLLGRDIINACAFIFDYRRQDVRLVFP